MKRQLFLVLSRNGCSSDIQRGNPCISSWCCMNTADVPYIHVEPFSGPVSQRKCFCWFIRLHMLLNQVFIHPISRAKRRLQRAWKGGYGALTSRRSGRRFLFFYSNSSLLQVLSLSSPGVCHVFSLMNNITLLRIVDGLVWAFPWLWQLASTFPFPADP